MNLDSVLVTISIRGTVITGADGKVVVQDHAKLDSSRRSLKLPSYAADILIRRRVESYCEWEFPSAMGTLRWPNNLRRNWREALDGKPYAEASPRSPPKAVATLLRGEMGIEAAMGQLGHSTDAVTGKHYVQPRNVDPDATAVLSTWAENDG